jgi:type VI protein secretion system component VasK
MTDPQPPSEGGKPQGEKWYERTRYQVLLFTVGIALFVLVGGLILDWYIAPKTSGQKKDLVQALGLITAGVAGAVGIYFTWRGQRQARLAQEENQRSTQEQVRLTRQSQEQNQQATQAQLENAQEELRLTRQGQITERFT